MSVINSIMAIEKEEAKTICEAQNFRPEMGQKWHELDLSLSLEKLSDLHFLLSANSDQNDFDLLYQEDKEEGPWVYQLPEQFLDKIAQMDKESLGNTAKLWLETDDFIDEDWEETEVIKALEKLIAIANLAKQNAKSVVLRVCL